MTVTKRDWKVMGITVLILLAVYWLFLRKQSASAPTTGPVSERPITGPKTDPNQVDANGQPLKQ